MQLIYNNFPAESLDKDFWEQVKARFAGKKVSIIVREDETSILQAETFSKMEKLRKKLSKVKVDDQVDLSALANEVNL